MLKKKPNLFIFNSRVVKPMKVIAFILLFFVIENYIGQCVEPLGRFNFNPQKRWVDFYEMEEDIDLFFLGASHAYRSFDPEIFDKRLNINSFNIGSSSQNPIDSYYILNEVLRYKKPKMVVLEVTWLTMEGNDYEYNSATYNYDFMKFSTNKINYLFNGFELDQYIKANLLSVRYHENYKDSKTVKENIENKFINKIIPYKHEIMNEEYYKDKGFVASQKEVSYAKLINENQFNDYRGFNFNDRRLNYFKKIIKLCKENNIEIILVTAPIPIESIRKVSDYEKIHNFISGIAKEDDVEYLDFNLVNRNYISFRNQCFKDDNHLNFKGAKIMSNLLVDYIDAKNNKKAYDYQKVFYSSFEELFNYILKGIIDTSKLRNVYLINDPQYVEDNIKKIKNNVIKSSSMKDIIRNNEKLENIFANSDIVVINDRYNNKDLNEDIWRKIFKYNYQYQNYRIYFNEYDIRLNEFDKITPKYESYFTEWNKIDSIKAKDLYKVAYPIKLQGIRKEFSISQNKYGNENVIRITPDKSDQRNVIQIGYTLDNNDLNIDIDDDQTVTFIATVRFQTNNYPDVFVQDYVQKWERSKVTMNEFGWKPYIVRKKIRKGAEKISLGINWKPDNKDEWLEIKQTRIYVEDQKHN
jgi:hypothetical protein